MELLVFEGMWYGFNWDLVIFEVKYVCVVVLDFFERYGKDE